MAAPFAPLLAALLAQEPAPPDTAATPPRISAPHLDAKDIVIDGVLDEEAWSQALVITDFWMWQPEAGGAPQGETTVRIFHDDRRLYLGFTVVDPEPELIRSHVVPREEINADDQVGFSLDPFLDRHGTYAFWLNPLGVQQDFRDSLSGDYNLAWDVVWTSKGRRTDTGYVVEVALPFRSVPFRRGGEAQVWGLMLHRFVARDNRYYAWPQLNPNATNIIAQEGELALVPPARTGRLELNPTLTANQTWTPTVDGTLEGGAWDPWTDRLSPGLDVRFKPTPDLTLEGTANPDFSQVEADPFLLDVNVRYALYLDERRPFFLMNHDAFSDVNDTLYTRAIVDPLWGARFTGRLGGTQFGIMHTYDQQPMSSLVMDRTTPGFGWVDIGGRGALNQVVRVKQSLGATAHAGLTYAEKELVDEGFSGLHSYNRAGGLDGEVTLGDHWILNGQAMGSMTGRFDGEASFGENSFVVARRSANPGWNMGLGVRDVSTDYRAETSFQTRTGYTKAEITEGWRLNPSRLVWAQPALAASVTLDRDRSLPPEHWVGNQTEVQVTNTTYTSFGFGHGSELYAGTLFPSWKGWGALSADPASWLSLGLQAQGGGAIDYASVAAARELVGAAGVVLRPLPNVQVEGSYTHQTLWAEQGADTLFALNLVRAEANLQFTKALGLRGIGQWRDDEQTLQESILLSWLPSPGTAAWLGYSETRDVSGEEEGVVSRSVFAKVSGLFQL